VKLRLSQPMIGSALAVAAAVVVTGQAMSAPPKPYKARDIIAANQPALADACVMYPAECRFNVDGSVARVVGRRIVPNSHSIVLGHFRTSIGSVQEPSWDAQASNETND
jgi:hypothetical protein